MARARPAPTIAALATAVGPAGVSVVRVSGSEAHPVARRLCPALPEALPLRRLTLCEVRHPRTGAFVDEALVVLFGAGASFTGEPVAELHGHGGVAQSRALLEAVLAAGAEPAGPGAFTRRAVAHGRLDLARAEGLAEVVAAGHAAALSAARALLGGALSARIAALVDRLDALTAEVEAVLDFPEAVTPEGEAAWPGRLRALAGEVEALAASYGRGRRLRSGARVVLLGAPNAGKSSLLNALAGHDRALVDPEPGTTRDLVEVPVELEGLPVTLVDGAGLRGAAGRVEAAGIARIAAAAAAADGVVVVADTSVAPGPELARVAEAADGAPAGVVAASKSDLGAPFSEPVAARFPGWPVVAVSSVTGAGLAELGAAVAGALGARPVAEGEVVVSLARHHAALVAAGEGLAAAAGILGEGGPLDAGAEELRGARAALAAVIDRSAVAEDVLDRIFARFCIGK